MFLSVLIDIAGFILDYDCVLNIKNIFFLFASVEVFLAYSMECAWQYGYDVSS